MSRLAMITSTMHFGDHLAAVLNALIGKQTYIDYLIFA
jgi:hypothetical protein